MDASAVMWQYKTQTHALSVTEGSRVVWYIGKKFNPLKIRKRIPGIVPKSESAVGRTEWKLYIYPFLLVGAAMQTIVMGEWAKS